MDINNLWSGYDLNSKKQNSRCLAVNTILEGKYLVGPVLGQGGFGITYVGYDLNMESKIAIKEYFPVELVSRDTTTMHGDRVLSLSGEKSVTYKQGLKKYVAEAQNVSQFSEIPGVVSVKDFFYANETAYIVMEFIDGISLKDYLKEKGGRLTEEETLKIMRPVLEALVQVHKSGIIHRDISPDNIMLTFEGSGHGKIKSVKLIDFGAARMTAKNDQKSLTIILKHGYAPEEQYRTHGEQGPWTDVYALCAVLYRMLTGETPVPAMDRMFKDELKTPEQCGAKVSANTSAAILKGLAVKKDDRIQSVQELIGALYEGAKVKAASPRKGSNTKMFGVIGTGVAVAAAAVIAVVGIGGNQSSDKTQNAATEYAGEMNLGQEEAAFAARPEILEQGYKQTLLDGYHMRLSVRDDGTVHAQGANRAAIDEISDWSDVCAVAGGVDFSMALRTDGTILVVDNGIQGIENAEQWTDIVSISADAYSAFGLRLDGTVVSIGENDNGQCEVGQWTDITAIDTSGAMTVGAKRDGTLLAVGTSNLDYKNGVQKQGERVLATGWTDVIQIDAGGDFIFGLQKDGTVLCLNVGGEETEDEILECQRAVAEWEPVTAIHGTSSHTASLVGVTQNGTLEFCGGSYEKNIEPYCSAWTDIKDIETFGTNRLMAKKTDGTFVSTPLPTYGKGLEEMQDLVLGGVGDDKIVGLNPDGDLLLHGIGKDKITERLRLWTNLKMIDMSFSGNIGAVNEDGYCFFYGADDFIQDAYRNAGDGSVYQDRKEALLIDEKKAVQVSEGVMHRAILFEDGTVSAWGASDDMYTDPETGKRPSGSCDVSNWEGITAVEAYGEATIGLREDKTLIAVGEYPKEILEWKNIEYLTTFGWDEIAAIDSNGRIYIHVGDPGFGHANIAGWDGMMKEIALSSTHTVGLCKDGTVKAVGSNSNKQCEVEDWTNIKHVYVREGLTVGITEDGELKIAGLLDPDEWIIEETTESNGNSKIGNVSFATEEELGEQIAFYSPQNSIARCRFGSHMLFCEESGNVIARGSDEYGQCDVDMWDHVVQVAAGAAHSLGLRSDGTVFAAGRNHAGQCDVEIWENVVKIEAGQDLSLGVTEEGAILLAGQGIYDEDLGVVSSWTDIKAVDYEPFEGVVIGLRTDGTVLTEGGTIDASHVNGWQNVEDILYENGQLIGKETDGTIRLSMIAGEDSHSIYFEEMEPMRYFNDRSSIAVTADGTLKVLRDSGSWNYADILERIDRGLSGWNAANIDYNSYFYGITEDGIFYEQYLNQYGNSEPEDFVDLSTVHVVMSINDYPNLIGQTEDGKLLHYGEAQALRTFCDKYSFATPIKQILLNRGVICLLEDGTLMAEQNWIPKKNVSKMIYLEGQSYMAFLMKDGTVEIHNPYEEEDTPEDVKNAVKSWSHMRDIWECGGRVYGVCEDGSIVCANHESHPFMNIEITAEMIPYYNHYNIFAVMNDGEIEILNLDGDNANQSGRYQIDGWSGITALAMGESHTVGLRADGTVVATGSNHCGQCDVEDWENIVAIDAGGQCTIGLTADGQMLMAGSMN